MLQFDKFLIFVSARQFNEYFIKLILRGGIHRPESIIHLWFVIEINVSRLVIKFKCHKLNLNRINCADLFLRTPNTFMMIVSHFLLDDFTWCSHGNGTRSEPLFAANQVAKVECDFVSLLWCWFFVHLFHIWTRQLNQVFTYKSLFNVSNTANDEKELATCVSNFIYFLCPNRSHYVVRGKYWISRGIFFFSLFTVVFAREMFRFFFLSVQRAKHKRWYWYWIIKYAWHYQRRS